MEDIKDFEIDNLRKQVNHLRTRRYIEILTDARV